MVDLEKPQFDATAFLAQAGLGRIIVQLAPKDAFFSQAVIGFIVRSLESRRLDKSAYRLSPPLSPGSIVGRICGWRVPHAFQVDKSGLGSAVGQL